LFVALLWFAPAGFATISITGQGGWLESAFVEWLPVAGAASYDVYYSGQGISNQKIDAPLVRSYGSYFRADAMGLSAGTYTLKIVAIDSTNIRTDSIVSMSLTVLPHDRSGFAFDGGRVPGAYKADGTPKDHAVILYITENTKNTVTLTVTGANANPCVGLQTILDGFKKGNDLRPLIVRLVGQITDLAYMLSGDIVIENKNTAASYITLEGVGNDAVADGWGIRVKNASNIEIRNIGLMNCDSEEGDNIGLQQSNDHIWVHNCDLFYGHAGSDSDQAKGDGALDCKKSSYVTISYNHFWDTGKSNLLGNGGETPGYITYHHNWYDHSDSRHPRVREHSVHVYNNYFDGISKYGAGATEGSSVFVENNFFRSCKKPMLISMQGSDISGGGGGTFSSEDGGMIKSCGNHYEGTYTFVPYSATNTVEFDAYEVTDRTLQVPATIKSKQGNNTYNNFDTNSSLMYACTPQTPADAKTAVMLYAGRTQGGDFNWTFNNATDDNDYNVNSALKTALTTYQTTLVAVQGETSQPADTTTQGGEVTEGDMVHNFTTQGKTSTFYSITGNLQTNASRTQTYAGLALTQYLKMESATSITFTTTQAGIFTMVLLNNSKTIKVNGEELTPDGAGIVTLAIPAGAYEVRRGNGESYLFFMSVVYNTTAVEQTTDTAPVSFADGVLRNPAKLSLQVFDTQGRLLASGNGDIALKNAAKGIYLVRIKNSGNLLKFVY